MSLVTKIRIHGAGRYGTSKHQHPSSREPPSTNSQFRRVTPRQVSTMVSEIGACDLELLWSLDLGAWRFMHQSFPTATLATVASTVFVVRSTSLAVVTLKTSSTVVMPRRTRRQPSS